MKVFLSHKQEDAPDAARIASELRNAGVDVYLDVLDAKLPLDGDQLSDHLIGQLQACTHLMAAVSEQTKGSWWVPFEIGIATERRCPISTYAIGACSLPEYLRKWPYLQSGVDLLVYVQVALGEMTRLEQHDLKTAALNVRKTYAESFHRTLKRRLGQ